MPRKPRKQGYTGVYHVMLRGINRQVIFEDDADRYKLLETIKRYKAISDFKLYSYCLMDNHVHLLMQEKGETISKAIQRISASYVHWYNNKYERTGHLFQERYKRENVDTYRYFLTVLRYIHQNPLKANIASNVFDSRWTSIHEYLHHPDIVDVDIALRVISKDRNKALHEFIQYVQQTNNDECLDDVVKVKVSDDEVRDYITQIGIPNSSSLQQMDKEKRNVILQELKQLEGISIRQLARITGIPKSIIQRVK